MSLLKSVVIAAIVLMVAFGAYYLYQTNPGLIEKLAPPFYGTGENVNASSEVLQFYPNMRFKSKVLTYNIGLDCDENKRRRLLLAFEIVSNETEVLSFSSASNANADILVSCSKNAYQKGERVFISGEGGPTKIIELSPYPLILQGRIILYNEDDCDYPITEIHELLHVFGFEHISNSKLIMYPYLNCQQKISPDLINKLKEIYSVTAKADLKFSNVSAIKSGKYLNLSFQIKNEGLITSEKILLEIYADGTKIDSENIEAMDSGTGQEFKLSNIKLLSEKTQEITLSIKTSSEEYSKENNFIAVKIN